MLKMFKKESFRRSAIGLAIVLVLGVITLTIVKVNLPIQSTTGVAQQNPGNMSTEPTNTISNSTNAVNTTELMEKYLSDHGYSISNETGGGNLAGAKIQLPHSFNDVIKGVKIGEILKQKNDLSKQNNLDFSKYLGEKVSIFTWGLKENASYPYGNNAFFLVYNNQIVGVWFEPNGNGQKNTSLSLFESIL